MLPHAHTKDRPDDHLQDGPLERLRQARHRRPLVIAHRGSSATMPENTLPAFEQAILDGAHMIEMDVRETADGSLVCMHDPTLGRTTTDSTNRPIAEIRDAELATLQAGQWKGEEHRDIPVPTLIEALRCVRGRVTPMIERKSGPASAYVAAIRELGMEREVFVQSFDWDFVAEVRSMDPQIVCGMLGPGPTAHTLSPKALARLDAFRPDYAHWSIRRLDYVAYDALEARAIPLIIYTGDGLLPAAGCVALGAAGITTNRPREMHLELDRAAALASFRDSAPDATRS